MKLTKDQEGALKFLTKFIHSSDLIATLKGAAGTGKTFILNEFLKTYNKSVCVTAPTHIAVRVVEQMTGKKGMTLHSLYGLRLNVDLATFDIDNQQFDSMVEPKMRNYKLVIIDESSMVNYSLFKLTLQNSKLYNVKVIFVGDSYQLPPINEELSSVFKLDNIFELREIIRQDVMNPISDKLILLRNDIDTYNTTCIRDLMRDKIENENINSIPTGYAILNHNNFNNIITKFFKGSGIETLKNVRALAFTNDLVDDLNYQLRSTIFNSNDAILKNDILVGHTNIFDRFMTPIILNSMTYIVDNVQTRLNDYEFETFEVNCRSIIDNAIVPTFEIVNHRSNTFSKYNEILRTYYNNAIHADSRNRSRLWRMYYDFRNKYVTMVDIQVGRNKIAKKSISYGYATTIHKAQGVTFNNVFLNLDSVLYFSNGHNAFNVRNLSQIRFRLKLLYVALSRAKYKTIMLNNKQWDF